MHLLSVHTLWFHIALLLLSPVVLGIVLKLWADPGPAYEPPRSRDLDEDGGTPAERHEDEIPRRTTRRHRHRRDRRRGSRKDDVGLAALSW